MIKGKRMHIWTAASRNLLYEKLVDQFGPYSEWESWGLPGRGLDEQYQKFLDAFAVVVSATSGDAVKHQIMFAVPIRDQATWEVGHARNAILNIAAALHAGFICQADLPDLVVATKIEMRVPAE